jgi:membrane protein insertase Oxa1/YidC/SpoIIIJ
MQRKIFGFMPWILMVIMAPFAAGLQLYWVTNNILSIAQQKLLYWRNPEMKMATAGATPPPSAPTPAPPPKAGPDLSKPAPNQRRRSGGNKPRPR